MAMFVTLATFTDKGIGAIKDTTKRADAFRELAKAHGATVKELLWTMGAFDIVSIVEAPDEMAMTSLTLALGKSGNIRGQTLRAFSQADMGKILAKVN